MSDPWDLLSTVIRLTFAYMCDMQSQQHRALRSYNDIGADPRSCGKCHPVVVTFSMRNPAVNYSFCISIQQLLTPSVVFPARLAKKLVSPLPRAPHHCLPSIKLSITNR